MNLMTNLIAQLEQLSPEQRAQVADYIEFLQWRARQDETAPPRQWSYSFVETSKRAYVHPSLDPAGMDTRVAPATVGGERRPALWAHPPVTGQAIFEYHVPIPQQVETVTLQLAIGIRDGAQIAEDNMVAFSVRVNGMRVWGQQSNSQSWQAASIPLEVVSGDMARIEFATEALGSHEWTWAVWGDPELVGSRE